MRRVINVLVFVLIVLKLFTSCKGNDGTSGPAGPSGVEIYSVVANPSVVRPGASASLNVSAGDGVNSALTYSWQADAGTLSSNNTSSVTWTAPASVGSYLVSVEVSNEAGLKSRGYASVLVSASPMGPIITSVNPAEVKAGDQIRITGAGFGSSQGSSSVSINSAPTATIVSWSDTAITAIVPAGATTGSVIVTEAGVNSSPGYIVVLWATETPENVAISVAVGDVFASQIISDGSGGAIITWIDSRTTATTGQDIYAQRVNSAGVVQWAVNGVAISTATGNQSIPQLTSDGSGGAIITWEDTRNSLSTGSDIYAQRVNSDGVVQWTSQGVAISTAANSQLAPQLISDNSGGAIITWHDGRNGFFDIYAQRVNSAGVKQWTADGVAVSAAANSQFNSQLISDGSGGAIITWIDSRTTATTGQDIYAQRVNSDGAVQWAVDGVAITTAALSQLNPLLTTDGSGGAIIAWEDSRNAGISDIYAQRVNSAGVLQWTPSGVAISTAANYQQYPQLISDGSGGAIITWQELLPNTAYNHLYAQRVNSAGAVQWMTNGVAISTAAGMQFDPRLISDGSGGAIITWTDSRNAGIYDIYAQRVNSAGAAQWAVDGLAISTAAGIQLNPVLIPDGSGGAIIVWEDRRNGNYDIYAQGISASGRQ